MMQFEYIKTKIQSVFNRGLTNNEIATSISIAILLTTFPFYGLTTILLTLITVKLKLNLPFTITISYLMEPLRFLLFISFVKIGGWLSNVTHATLSIHTIKEQLFNAPIDTIKLVSHELICAIMGWFIVILPFSFLLYITLKTILPILKKNKVEISEVCLKTYNLCFFTHILMLLLYPKALPN